MKNRTEQLLPVARKEGMVVQELSEEVLVYDVDQHKAHCLNQTAAFVWKHCDGQTSLAEIAGLMERQLKTPVRDEVVWIALDQLGKAHLLQERMTRPAAKSGMSRRDVIRRIGWAAAALPLVTTIVAPRAVEAVSPCPPCTMVSDCITNGPPCPTANCISNTCV